MTDADAATSGAEEAVAIHEHFDRPQEQVWSAIVDGEQMSRWFGGECRIEPRVGGAVRLESPDVGVAATGVVRAFRPPQEGYSVAHLEHTFVDSVRPDLTSICRWQVVVSPSGGCDLYFRMDGAGEADSTPAGDGAASPPGAYDSAVTADEARRILASARTVLLVDWVLPEIPSVISSASPLVYGKTGPGPDDWAVIEPDGDSFRTVRSGPPEQVDLLHLDWTLGFEEFVGVATDLGATTFWYHSARTRPPEPASNRGCWVPLRQSARQRRRVEAAGMTYVDTHYIVDIARSLASSSRP
ncbi:MAG TPA: SRPBCC domain-containing protein [Acidimicrobiales bacterium]|nr:SRPBCC domain-containing protein [Acidimicrobiales bacterium]